MAKIYYVDGDNGNDAWTGEIEEPTPVGSPTDGPFATVGQVDSVIAVGDEVRIVKSASAYNENGFALSAYGASQESERIIIRGWVVGQTALDQVLSASRPVLASIGGGADILNLDKEDYITIKDLEMSGADAGSDGVDLEGCSYLVVQRCKITNVRHGFVCTGDTPNNILIEDTDVVSVTGDGFLSSSGGNTITISRCHIDITGDEGVQVQHQVGVPSCSNVIIEDCFIEGFIGDAIICSECTTTTIRKNYMDCTSATGNGIVLNGTSSYTVEDNMIIDPTGSGIFVDYYATNPTLSGGGTIQRNVVHKPGGTGDFKRGIYVRSHDGNDGPVNIYSNTVYGTVENPDGGEGILYRFGDARCDGNLVCNVKNNISMANDNNGLEIRVDAGPYTDGTAVVNHGYNGYFGNGAANINDSAGVGNALGNDVITDLLVFDATNADFHLTPSSPCIGAGDPTLTSQHGDSPDIGALEYGAPVGSRLAHGKYYLGPTAFTDTLELVKMEN